MPAQYRDEAIAALAKLGGSTPAGVISTAFETVPADDELTREKLLETLFAQPASALRKDADFSKAPAAA